MVRKNERMEEMEMKYKVMEKESNSNREMIDKL
jgi:hypothetical protein